MQWATVASIEQCLSKKTTSTLAKARGVTPANELMWRLLLDNTNRGVIYPLGRRAANRAISGKNLQEKGYEIQSIANRIFNGRTGYDSTG